MQQGMLYDTLAAPGTGIYVIQVVYRLRGALHRPTFAKAWEMLVSRHPVLRTSFHWEDPSKPVQSVHGGAKLPVEERDWRGLPASEQAHRLTALLMEERHRGFDLTEPPLMRLLLIQIGDDIHEFVLVHHHLLLDGWCKDLLFGEAFAFYQALLQDRRLELPLPRPYRDYILWLRGQELSEAEGFWRKELDGFGDPTPLWSGAALEQTGEDYAEQRFELDSSVTSELRLFGRRTRLTPSTIVQGMWALLLSRVSGSTDVVFGATVSGRPAALSGAESMVGLFINTLPVRVRLPLDSEVVPWLQALQLRQAQAREYGHVSLAQIRRWSEVTGGRALFDSIVVFENNSGFGSEVERRGSIEVSDVRAVIRNSLPMTLRCVPGGSFSFQILYHCRRFSRATVQRIGEELAALLRATCDPGSRVQSLLAALDESHKRNRDVRIQAFDTAVRARLKGVRAARRRLGEA